MLLHLYIQDFAVVALADISFEKGMTVITGETGAGKSILLDALQLALGERSEGHWVRPGAEKAEIAATFDIASLPSAILWLNDLELTATDASVCIIRRIIYQNGRTRAFINGRPVTTSQLRLLGEYLIQIHGQNQQQILLKTQEQLRLVDAYGQHDTLVSQVKKAYQDWEKLNKRKQSLLDNIQSSSKNDLLQYQLAELEALQLQTGELAALELEHDKLAHAQEYIQSAQLALGLLEAAENNAQASLSALKFPNMQNASNCLENAQIQLTEAIHEINDFMQSFDMDPERLREIEQRLEQIHLLARKHRIDAKQLMDHHQALKKEAEVFLHHEEALSQIEKDLLLAREYYTQFARKLSQIRAVSAEKLTKAVTTGIQQLGMPGGLFSVSLLPASSETLHAYGFETVSFGFTANPGHPVQPLHKVASGGELSRISLAIELITANFLAKPCLVFDEVDVGISGKIGALVGKALRELGQSAQILCITHLPQVAACGEHHIQVTKTREEKSTVTHIQALDETQRIEEIAKMLGGIDVTPQARAHAKQLMT